MQKSEIQRPSPCLFQERAVSSASSSDLTQVDSHIDFITPSGLENGIQLSKTQIYRRKRRLRCCPGFAKSRSEHHKRATLLNVYLPSYLVVIGLLSLLFLAIYKLRDNDHKDSPRYPNLTTQRQGEHRIMDSADGTHKAGTLLDSHEFNVHQQCEVYRQQETPINFYNKHCKGNCGYDYSLLSSHSLSNCLLGDFISDSSAAPKAWMAGSSLCQLEDMVTCNAAGEITKLNFVFSTNHKENPLLLQRLKNLPHMSVENQIIVNILK